MCCAPCLAWVYSRRSPPAELAESGRATRATLLLLADSFRAVTDVGVEGRAPDPEGLKAVRDLADSIVHGGEPAAGVQLPLVHGGRKQGGT